MHNSSRSITPLHLAVKVHRKDKGFSRRTKWSNDGLRERPLTDHLMSFEHPMVITGSSQDSYSVATSEKGLPP